MRCLLSTILSITGIGVVGVSIVYKTGTCNDPMVTHTKLENTYAYMYLSTIPYAPMHIWQNAPIPAATLCRNDYRYLYQFICDFVVDKH